MGFELIRIATSANGFKVPDSVKCCICNSLLDDGIRLNGCSHNACYKCAIDLMATSAVCPIDRKPFNMKKCGNVCDEVIEWLRQVKLKCMYFDGRVCTATAVAIRNIHRHQQMCNNNPKNKKHFKAISQSTHVVKEVEKWIKSKDRALKYDTTKLREWIKDFSLNNDNEKKGFDDSIDAINANTEAKPDLNSGAIAVQSI